jgi:hypothetical protein
MRVNLLSVEAGVVVVPALPLQRDGVVVEVLDAPTLIGLRGKKFGSHIFDETRDITCSMSNPVIFKRTKSKTAQRSRQPSPGATEEDSGQGDVSPSTVVTKLKKRDKPKSKLSFGAYEEVRVLNALEALVLIGRKGRRWGGVQDQEIELESQSGFK